MIDKEQMAQLASLLEQLEKQQRLIGELQAHLYEVEEKAVNLDNKVFQMRTLLQSGKGFSQILNLQELLDAFMSVCRERYSAVNSAVLLRDDLDSETVSYRVRAFFGISPVFTAEYGEEQIYMFRVPYDQGLLWQLIQQGNVFPVRDLRKLPRFETAFRKWSLNVLQSDLWVPLIRGTEVLGILTLGECEDGTQIPETDYSFLEEIAAVAATNIDSTLKYEKNNRILKNLQTLYDVNQQLTNVNDFKRLIDETLESAITALEGQKANLMLVNPETGRLEIKLVRGNIPSTTLNAINNGSLETRSFDIGEGVSGTAAQMQKPCRINDRSRIEQIGSYPVYCILSVPILYGRKLEGVLTITNKVQRQEDGSTAMDPLGRFSEDDEQLLMSLADQAAVNLNKARLYSSSITDRLTGLYNSRHFETRFAEYSVRAGETRKPFCLAITDIDHFKRFNDTWGHRAGDLVLNHTAQVLQDIMGDHPGSECFRYGGEEFCVLLSNTDIEMATNLLERFRKTVENSVYPWEDEHISCQVSVGIAASLQVNHNIALFEAADRALYAAKQGGRNRTCVHIDTRTPEVLS